MSVPRPALNAPYVLEELFKLLPEPGSEWPIERRARWLQAASAIFNVVYGDIGEFDITWSVGDEHEKSERHSRNSAAAVARRLAEESR